MDWTQALAQFAGGYAKSNALRQKVESDRKIREAAAKAQQDKWERDYKFRVADAAARAAENERKIKADVSGKRVEDFGKAVSDFGVAAGEAGKRLSSIINPVDLDKEYQFGLASLGPSMESLRYRYENDPDVKAFYNPSGNVPFETFIKSRVASPFIGGTSARPPISFDPEKMREAISGVIKQYSEDVGLNANPEALRAALQPFIRRMIAGGMSEQDIYSNYPELTYGLSRETEVPDFQVQPGAVFKPVESAIPVERPQFGEQKVFGGQAYRLGLPSQIRPQKDLSFQEAVSSVFPDMDTTGMIGSRSVPGLGVDIPEVRGPSFPGAAMQRAASVLTEPGFMGGLGITGPEAYADPEVQRRALAGMFAAQPGFARSKTGQRFAEMLQKAPVERAPVVSTTKKVAITKMPPLTQKAKDEALSRGLDIRINTLKLNLETQTFDDKVKKAHLDVILPMIKMDFERDKFLRAAAQRDRVLGIQASALDIRRATETRQYNTLLTQAIPNVINGTVNALSGVVGNYGKALGNSITQAQITALTAQAGIPRASVQEIVNKLRMGQNLTAAEKTVVDGLKTIPGADTYSEALDNYKGASAKLNQYLEVQKSYSGYLQQAASMLSPGEALLTPNPDIYFGDTALDDNVETDTSGESSSQGAGKQTLPNVGKKPIVLNVKTKAGNAKVPPVKPVKPPVSPVKPKGSPDQAKPSPFKNAGSI